MEEVYVIRLRGGPCNVSSTDSSTEPREPLRTSVVGLGVLHLVFGTLVLLFGALRTIGDQEPASTIFGILFGPVFAACGISALLSWRPPLRDIKVKVFFYLSSISLVASVAFVCMCVWGVILHHSVPRAIGENAHLTANALVAALAEAASSLVSVLVVGPTACGHPSAKVEPPRRRVIVKTDLSGNGPHLSEMVKHVSPHCVISLRAGDDAYQKVQAYLQAQEETSFTFSEPSSLHSEQEVGLDSQHWGNDVMKVLGEHETALPEASSKDCR